MKNSFTWFPILLKQFTSNFANFREFRLSEKTLYGDNENHPDNKNEGNYPANKYMFKINNRKNLLVSLWLALNIFHTFF